MITPSDQNTTRPTPKAPKEVIERWEGEGGRPSEPSDRERAVAACARELPKDVNVLEDEIMAVESPDGLPPPKEMRDKEWRWVKIVAPSILIPGILIAAALVSVPTLLAAVGVLIVLAVAAFPVWGSALMRGREHKRAQAEAEALATGVIVDINSPVPSAETVKKVAARAGCA